MTRLLLPLTLALLLPACGSDDTCPSPLTPEGRCVCSDGLMPTPRMDTDAGYDCVPAEDASTADGSPDADAATDAAPDTGDAGGCPMGCPPHSVCDPDAQRCVDCLVDTDCGRDPALRSCSPMNTCVECLEDAGCIDAAASQCDMHACAPCADNPDCAGIMDETGTTALGICDTSAATATCVECTATDDSACGTNVCDLLTNLCTDRPKNSAGLCQPCVNDTECSTGQLCVPTRFEDTDIGHFCLWREDAGGGGPAGDCIRSRPYVGSEMHTSISGVMTSVCTLRSTTCPALCSPLTAYARSRATCAPLLLLLEWATQVPS